MSDNLLSTQNFFQSIGLPKLHIHQSFNHFDFTREGRRILVIGPMGSGKTEYSARVWRDSRVALRKNSAVERLTCSHGADRRKVFFIRSSLDRGRFPDCPPDALAFRGGFERLGDNLAWIRDSFDLEELLRQHPDTGTWIIDEASFYDERMAWVMQKESESRGLIFIMPTLILNFRREIFNATARFILDSATDVFPLSAYCEHPECLCDGQYTYRYYLVDGQECPALYFDPLIIIGGDRVKEDPREPNYGSRCEEHHHLPGKEYTFLILKPLGMEAARGNPEPLRGELLLLSRRIADSALGCHFREKFPEGSVHHETNMRALAVPCIAEKALLFLLVECNLVPHRLVETLVKELDLDREYLNQRLVDNGRPPLE